MNDVQLIIIVVAFSALIVAEIVSHYLDRKQLTGALADTNQALLIRVDRGLAPYGKQLKPIHDAAMLIESLIDEPTDVLATLLPDDLRLRLVAKLDQVELVTDGIAPEVAENTPVAGTSRE
jgi:hypothetical protein